MAFVDQDRSREKLLSGLASVTLVGVVGYVLVTGLAINVIRTMGNQVTLREWKTDVPPPPPPIPQKLDKAPKADHPVFAEKTIVPPLTPPQQQIETSDVPPLPIPPTATQIAPTQNLPPATLSKAIDARPRGNPADWVTTDDYPATALRNGQQGRTSFRLDIGTDGRPTSCAITQTSGSPELDQAACRNLMRKARFSAARDAGGAPVVSSYSNSVVWRLPQE